MKLGGISIYALAILLGLSSDVQAISVLSLTSSMAPDSVRVGQAITVDVELTGLESGMELDSLAATVGFDSTLLGVPIVSTGPILPNAFDNPLDLLITTDPGFADVAFLTFGLDAADHIASNGVFFSFEVTALATGSGEIAIGFVGATRFNAAIPNDPIVLPIDRGLSLPFVVVPEPSGLAPILAAGFGLAAMRGSRMRRS